MSYVPPWERPGWVRVPIKRKRLTANVLREREAKYLARWMNSAPPETKLMVPMPKTVRRRARKPNDTAPAHIQKARADFCETFLKTGVINTELQDILKRYADEVRHAKASPVDHTTDAPAIERRRPGRPRRSVADTSGPWARLQEQ